MADKQELSTDVSNVMSELNEKFYNIPFENSDFQNEMTNIRGHMTPARAYRSIGLRMYNKIGAINELKYARLSDQVNIDEWQSTIESDDSSTFEKRRAQIKIDKQLSMVGYTDKLLNDAIHELNFMYSRLQEFPDYTRESFEHEEETHFILKHNLQINSGGNGSKEALCVISDESKGIFEANLLEANEKLKICTDTKQK